MTTKQDVRLDALLEDFQSREQASAARLHAIKRVISESPYLASLVDTALDRGVLKGFTHEKVAGSGGHFSDETGRIAIDLETVTGAANGKTEYLDALTGTLAHEVGHAINQPNRQLGQERFNKELNAHVGTRLDVHDPTGLALNLQRSQRWDESYAELHSVNAVVSRIQHLTPDASDKHIRERVDPTSACTEKNPHTNKIEWASNSLPTAGSPTPRNPSKPSPAATSTCPHT